MHRIPLETAGPDDRVMYTDGNYFLTLRPLYRNFGNVAKKPFVILSDVFWSKKMRVSSWREFSDGVCDGFQWLLENTTITEETFALARANPLVAIPFTIDWAKYRVGRSDKIKLGEGFAKI